jgi:hypothetical protein
VAIPRSGGIYIGLMDGKADGNGQSEVRSKGKWNHGIKTQKNNVILTVLKTSNFSVRSGQNG